MDLIQKVLRTMCRRVGSPVAARVSAHASAGEWRELLELKVDPRSYSDAFTYWSDAMCVDLLRKCVLPAGQNTGQAAVDTFLETERDCYRVNQRIRTMVGEDPSKISADTMAFIEFLFRWKLKIRAIMGKVPSILEPAFSGGATTHLSRLEATLLDKLSTTPERYSHSTLTVDHLYYQCGWGRIAFDRQLFPNEVVGNQYFTVPKSGLTDRSCCKEAVMNVAYQLAVGKILRRRLRKAANVDLNHGAALHQQFAREGSLTGRFATLDMSSASDRWARELVRYLVPWDWEILLNDLRATHTTFGSKRLYLEKFSSMGNGFTFELETILFYTLAQTVAEDEGRTGEILCYGDDLIVPTEISAPVLARLTQVGHRPNMKKSFWEGPFRESCGGDFFYGEMVNTVKLEMVPEEPQHWISLANNLRRVCAGRPRYWALVKPVWDAVIECIPHQIRVRGPEHLGDQVIHDLEPHWARRDDGCIRSYVPVIAKRELRYYREIGRVIIYGYLLMEDLAHGVPLRKVEGYRLRWVDPYSGSQYLPGDKFIVTDRRHRESQFRCSFVGPIRLG